VDADFEVRRDAAKDKGVRAYVEMFLAEYRTRGSLSINAAILASDVHLRMLEARREFVANAITDPGQYDAPPKSVEILPLTELQVRHPGVLSSYLAPEHREAVLYNVGMTGIRSDPYTGMAMLYRYLYIAEQPSRALVLWFPRIAVSDWRAAARRASRKDVRLFRIAADAIIFANAVLSRRDL
jgi:hypothetical protein